MLEIAVLVRLSLVQEAVAFYPPIRPFGEFVAHDADSVVFEGRNIQAAEPVGSRSVIMWLTAQPLARAAVGLLPNYPVVSP
ncbi:hypothetical protein Mycsm_00821 [Mycobacterium sp. JS623]|nr:hypothetical protein Mycsm_00821 [Mycobacterium sp. JS623]